MGCFWIGVCYDYGNKKRKSMFQCLSENKPRWYEVVVDQNGQLRIYLHRVVYMDLLERLDRQQRFLGKLAKLYEIPEFGLDPSIGIGFGCCLHYEEYNHADSWLKGLDVCLCVPIPDGKMSRAELTVDQKKILASVTRILDILQFSDELDIPLIGTFYQLALYDLSLTVPLGISVELSAELTGWFAQNSESVSSQLVDHMKAIYQCSFPEVQLDFQRFHASVSARGPIFMCPGSACTLDGEMKLNESCNLMPHNIDTIGQIFTLMAGVSRLVELFYESKS